MTTDTARSENRSYNCRPYNLGVGLSFRQLGGDAKSGGRPAKTKGGQRARRVDEARSRGCALRVTGRRRT